MSSKGSGETPAQYQIYHKLIIVDSSEELKLHFEKQVMSSKETKFNPGSGATPGWRNKLGAVQRGFYFLFFG